MRIARRYRMVQAMQCDSVTDVLDRMLQDNQGERISLGEIVRSFGARAYGPALAFIALISMTPPISITPLLPVVTGALMLVLSVQLLLLRRTPWLPESVCRYSFSRERLQAAVENARPWLARLNRVVCPRLTFLVLPPFLNLIGVICVLLSLLSWVLAPLPGGENIPAAAILFFGLALTERDGLLALIGLIVTAASIALLIFFRNEIGAAIVNAAEMLMNFVTQVEVRESVLWVLGGLLLVLSIGSVIRVATLLRRQEPQGHIRSLLTWWGLFLLLAIVVLLGSGVAAGLFAVVSLMGLGEFRRLAHGRVASQFWWLAFLAVPFQYVIAYQGWLTAFWTLIPIGMFLVLLTALVITAETGRFVETAGIVFLGLMLIVFLLSHAVLVFSLRDGAALFLYMIVLTSVNDIAQALWGRRFGRRKIAPRVSPNKSWEGFLLGGATTVAVAMGLGGVLTPFAGQPLHFAGYETDGPWLPAILIAVLMICGGFFGDLTFSAVKREVGVKDSGDVLPGQGGVLDRIDSLTFTAPLFYYFIHYLYR